MDERAPIWRSHASRLSLGYGKSGYLPFFKRDFLDTYLWNAMFVTISTQNT
jgi:hypothetical protein